MTSLKMINAFRVLQSAVINYFSESKIYKLFKQLKINSFRKMSEGARHYKVHVPMLPGVAKN